jgi:hypothetical protein
VAEAKVLTIPEGSLLVLFDINLGEPDTLGTFCQELVELVGHTRFAVLSATTNDGTAEVWSLDDDIAGKLRDLLHANGARTAPIGG